MLDKTKKSKKLSLHFDKIKNSGEGLESYENSYRKKTSVSEDSKGQTLVLPRIDEAKEKRKKSYFI